MTRPSQNTDWRLIRAGRELLPEPGITGLSLRREADRAGVNLGMFHWCPTPSSPFSNASRRAGPSGSIPRISIRSFSRIR